MQIQHGDWVVIANGGKYLVLANHGDDERIDRRVRSHETQDNPSDREQSANRPGRGHDHSRAAPGDTGAPQKSAFDDTDWHELEKTRFAADLADRLYKQAHKGEFDRLVIAADPSTLGELRSHFHQAVSDKIVAEVDKDFTNHPIEEIERHLLTALD